MTTVAIDRRTKHDRDLLQLQLGLRVFGVLWAAFFSLALLNLVFHFISHDSAIAPLVMWGHGGDAYLAMLSAINVVMGVFLVLSASDPIGNRMLIDFVIVANTAHMGLMLAMAIFQSAEHTKLMGDVPTGIVATAVLAVLWLRVRPRSRDTASSSG